MEPTLENCIGCQKTVWVDKDKVCSWCFHHPPTEEVRRIAARYVLYKSLRDI